MGTLKILCVKDPAVKGYLHESKTGLTRAFETAENIKIELDIYEWDKYGSKVDAYLDSTAAVDYDVVMCPGNFWLPNFVEMGKAEPLDAYLDQNYVEGIFEIVREEMTVGEGTYLIPSFTDGHILFYRKDIFLEKGIDVPSDQVVDFAWIRSTAEKLGKRLALKAHVSEILLDFLPFFWEEGQQLFTSDDKFAFFSEKSVIALEKYVQLKAFALDGTANFGNEEIADAIRSGEAHLAVSWSGQAAEIMRENKYRDQLGFLTYKEPANVTWGFVVNPESAKKEMAVKYLTFLTNETNDQIVGEISGSPVRMTSYQDGKARLPWLHTGQLMLDRAHTIPKKKIFGAIANYLYSYLHQALLGEITPEEALANAFKEAENI